METKDKIKLTIFRLLQEKGYNNTTYQEIANLSGFEKTLIQYHFPKKNMFMTFYIENLVSKIVDYLNKNIPELKSKELEFIISSKIYSKILLHEHLLTNITIPILQDRDLLTKIQNSHEKTVLSILDVKEDKKDEFLYLLRFAQGGYFDIMYRSIIENKKFDIDKNIKLMISIISNTINLDDEKIYNRSYNSLLYEDKINDSVNKIINMLGV